MSAKYLFRLSAIPTNCWHTKSGTYYVVSESKENAREYLEKHLRDGYRITSCALLGEEYGGCLFGKVHK